jgi:hypothetical protein
MSPAPREINVACLNNKGEKPSQPGEYRIHKGEITQRGIGQSFHRLHNKGAAVPLQRLPVCELLQLNMRGPAHEASFIRKSSD